MLRKIVNRVMAGRSVVQRITMRLFLLATVVSLTSVLGPTKPAYSADTHASVGVSCHSAGF